MIDRFKAAIINAFKRMFNITSACDPAHVQEIQTLAARQDRALTKMLEEKGVDPITIYELLIRESWASPEDLDDVNGKNGNGH